MKQYFYFLEFLVFEELQQLQQELNMNASLECEFIKKSFKINYLLSIRYCLNTHSEVRFHNYLFKLDTDLLRKSKLR